MFIHCSSAPAMLTCLNRWPWHLAELRCAPGRQCGIVAPALHSYSMGGSVSTKLWRFHHPLLLLPDPAFAFWSGANESRFIASLAECKISRREEIGKIPSLTQGSVLSCPPVSSTERCWCSPCARGCCLYATPLSQAHQAQKDGRGVTEVITGCHHRRLSLIFLPSPTLKASLFSPLFLLPGGFQNFTGWLV